MARKRRRRWLDDEDVVELNLLDGESVAGEREEMSFTLGNGDSLCDLLTTGELLSVKPIPWGSNYSFAVVLGREGRPGGAAVYKPRRGEVPLWDFPEGTLYRREYAAYVAASALGLAFVPTTVIRDGPHGVGTFQQLVEAADGAEYYGFRGDHVDELRAISLFDVISNNADRKAGHFLKGRDGRIWGIDHGLTFNVVPKLRTVVWDFCGQPLPEPLYEQLFEFCTDSGRTQMLRDQLGELLHPNEVDAFFVRLERVVERGEFPVLDPYRNVPRGFW